MLGYWPTSGKQGYGYVALLPVVDKVNPILAIGYGDIVEVPLLGTMSMSSRRAVSASRAQRYRTMDERPDARPVVVAARRPRQGGGIARARQARCARLGPQPPFAVSRARLIAVFKGVTVSVETDLLLEALRAMPADEPDYAASIGEGPSVAWLFRFRTDAECRGFEAAVWAVRAAVRRAAFEARVKVEASRG